MKAWLWEEEREMQQVEQPAETSFQPSKMGVVFLFSSQRVISFSTDAELNSACANISAETPELYLITSKKKKTIDVSAVTVAQNCLVVSKIRRLKNRLQTPS